MVYTSQNALHMKMETIKKMQKGKRNMYMTELDESLVGSYNQQNYRYRNYLYNLYKVAVFTGQILLNSIHPYISEVERCIRTSGKTEVF